MVNLYKDLLGTYEEKRMEDRDFLSKNLLDFFYSNYSYDFSERNKQIFIERYVERKTFKEIADKYHLSVERVRSIVNCTLNKLKNPHRLKAIVYGIKIYELEKQANEEENELLKHIEELKTKIEKVKRLNVKLDNATNEELLDYSEDINAPTQNSIETLELSVRSYNCLRRSGYHTIADVLKDRHQLYKIRNLGRKSLKEVLIKLVNYGYMSEEEGNNLYHEVGGRSDIKQGQWW